MAGDRMDSARLSPGDVALLRDLAESAAEKAVSKTFLAMGLDVNDPISAQRDFGVLRDMTSMLKDDEFHRDLEWTRRTRKLHDGMVGKIVYSSIGLAVLGAANALWTGIKALMLIH